MNMESKEKNTLEHGEILKSGNGIEEEKSLLVENAFEENSSTYMKESISYEEDLEILDKDNATLKKDINVKETPINSKSSINDIFKAIEEGFPKENTRKEYIFPHPRYWLGPRFLALWALPIALIKSFINLIKSSNPVRPYKALEYTIRTPETIFTSTRKAFRSSNCIRFFGALFIAIWVLPFAITGIVIDYLFVSPLTGRVPF